MSDQPIIFAEYPPIDGKNYGGYCARCGSSAVTVSCENCEDGFDGHECGEDCCMCAYPEPNVPCQYCYGYEHWYVCASSPEWCRANPLAGREKVDRGTFEWFVIEDDHDE